MPVIARFYGVIIRMYFAKSEHNPPHVHAIYGESVAALDIQTLQVLEGSLPNKAMEMVIEWVNIHKEELLEMWYTQEFKQLTPLE